ncbi:2-halobenzoate 1,2-dioxygenase large subunit [compost metagenome]
MATPDDLEEFRSCQMGYQGSTTAWNDMSRGAEHWIEGADAAAEEIDLKPLLSGVRTEDEGLFVLQHKYWQETMLQALAAEQAKLIAVEAVQ